MQDTRYGLRNFFNPKRKKKVTKVKTRPQAGLRLPGQAGKAASALKKRHERMSNI